MRNKEQGSIEFGKLRTEVFASDRKINVRVGENSRGMLFNQTGYSFPLAEILKDQAVSGTKKAPGTFEAIYFVEIDKTEAFINKLSHERNWTRIKLGVENSKEPGSLNGTDELPSELVIGRPFRDIPAITQIFVKRWGTFQEDAESRIRIPYCSIEEEYIRFSQES